MVDREKLAEYREGDKFPNVGYVRRMLGREVEVEESKNSVDAWEETLREIGFLAHEYQHSATVRLFAIADIVDEALRND